MKNYSLFTIIMLTFFGANACISVSQAKPQKSKTTAHKKLIKPKASKIKIYGAKEVSKTFGIPIEKINVPPIPWTQEELDKAHEDDRALVLRACPKEHNNTVADMIKMYPSIIGGEKKSLIADSNVSACTLRSGWVLVDIMPKEWTVECDYTRIFRFLPPGCTLTKYRNDECQLTELKKHVPDACIYGAQLTNALQHGGYSKLMPEALYDALLMLDEYKKRKNKMKDGYFVSRLASTTGVGKGSKDIVIVISGLEGKIIFGAVPYEMHGDDLYMLTQITNGY